MSKMQELYDKVAQDSDLQAKFSAVIENAQKDGEANVNDELIRFANSIGYDITLDEMIEFFREIAEDTDGDLSEAELDMVAGGKRGLAQVPRAILVGYFSFFAELDDSYSCLQFLTPPKYT